MNEPYGQTSSSALGNSLVSNQILVFQSVSKIQYQHTKEDMIQYDNK